jgi:site-specific DNA recombinase
MTPTVTKKGSRHYRYYTSMDAIRNRACEGRDSFVRLNAGMVESAVVQHIRSLLRTPEIAARAVEAARRTDPDMDEQDVVTALAGFKGLWELLFPAEQARIARLLIERVTVSANGLAVDLRTEGLGSVIRELVTPKQELAA